MSQNYFSPIKINQAVILSAGLGTRLKPLTDNLPKAMVPIGGKPLLECHIEQFKKYGVKEFFINLHYLPDAIMDYFGDGSKFGVKIQYVFEPEILGTAGGIKDFDGLFDENFFLIYGDIFSLVDYSKMRDYFASFGRRAPEIAGIEIVGDTDHPFDSDLVEVDDSLKFLKIYPKPHQTLPQKYKSMRGVYIFNKKILNYIPTGKYYEIDHQLLPEILEKGETFYGCEPSPTDFWKDVGTMERYQKVQEYLKNFGE